MSIKYFCDICDVEIADENRCSGGSIVDGRLGITKITKAGALKAELIITWNGSANSGQFCKYCILTAFAELDDRPRGVKQ